MLIHDIEQGTPEWHELRAGKMTASMASKLITATGKISTQYKGEIGRVIAEKLDLQEPETIQQTYWMERGVELEGQARAWLEVLWNQTVHQCGFISSDDGYLGVSPDGYVMEGDKLIPVEIKCGMPSTHISWLLSGELPAQHRAQVHFAMVVTGAPYAWFMSYNPDLAPLLIKVEWTEFTEALKQYTEVYKAELAASLFTITGETK
jgi:putative phage-type endonuclease